MTFFFCVAFGLADADLSFSLRVRLAVTFFVCAAFGLADVDLSFSLRQR